MVVSIILIPSLSLCTMRTSRIQRRYSRMSCLVVMILCALYGAAEGNSQWEAPPQVTTSRNQGARNSNEESSSSSRVNNNLSQAGFKRWPDDEMPPPPPPSSNYNPIDYNFASRQAAAEQQAAARSKRQQQDESHDDDNIPQTYSEPLPEPDDDKLPKYASPRRDVIARYMSQSRTRALLMLSSGTVGGLLGSFIGKSLLNRPQSFAVCFSVAFVVCTYLRNPYGEFVKALGMALILALQRSRNIWRRYPTWKHVKASIGADQRRPFPPDDNPWAYQAVEPQDVDFNMLYTVLAMGFIGSLCGGNVPLIPTWIGSLAGAGLLAFGTTTRDARGDLARSMGMRVVSLGQEVIGINSELELLSKFGVVSGKVLDKILILDRKHRIKDRLIAGFSWAVDQVSQTAAQVQVDMQAQPEEPPTRGGQDFSRRPRSDESEDDDRRRQREGDPNARPFPYKQGDPRPR